MFTRSFGLQLPSTLLILLHRLGRTISYLLSFGIVALLALYAAKEIQESIMRGCQ